MGFSSYLEQPTDHYGIPLEQNFILSQWLFFFPFFLAFVFSPLEFRGNTCFTVDLLRRKQKEEREGCPSSFFIFICKRVESPEFEFVGLLDGVIQILDEGMEEGSGRSHWIQEAYRLANASFTHAHNYFWVPFFFYLFFFYSILLCLWLFFFKLCTSIGGKRCWYSH